MERYIGEIKIIQDPKFEDIQIMWMTNEQWIVDKKTKNGQRKKPGVCRR
jgi:hypothetical protein